nr:hypothetical protein 6 [Halieaceae bacterium]
MLTQVDIAIDDLVLDPNNPRFASDFEDKAQVPDEELVGSEEQTLNFFTLDDESDDEQTTSTGDLFKSMMNIGYVPIDRVVVRKITGENKYLVIEGNRRISTVKKLLASLEKRDRSHEELAQIDTHADSFRTIPCKLIDTDGKSQKEVDHMISLILGIRHHGSLLEWEPLSRAYNIYTEYISVLEGGSAKFKIEKRKVQDIASRLSISAAKVRSSLHTYLAYLQLDNALTGVKDKHYSLIEAAISSRPMKSSGYINQDLTTGDIDDQTIDRLNTLLQFDKRESADYAGKKIVNDTAGVRAFGELIKRRSESEHEATREYVQSQIDEVLDLNSDTTIDDANDSVVEHLNRTKWVETINRLIDDQEAKLSVEDFTGIGNDLAALEQLQKRLNRLLLVL